MYLSRKEFLKTGALITGGILLHGHKFFLSSDQPKGFKLINDKIGIFTERGGTIAWFVDKNAAAVVDSQFPESAKNFIGGLKQKTDRKIDRLFNTHHHHDHTSGNIFLKDFTEKIVAHENCKMLQEKSYGGDTNKPQAYADTTFKNTWEEKIGSERISARYFGPAHTGCDAVIHFQESNIAHVGDLVFNKTFPFIDPNGGGSIEGWISVLEKIEKFYSNGTQFVFGHAISDELVTGKMRDVTAMKNYFEALIDFVSKGIKNGKPKDEITSASAIHGFDSLKERWDGARKMNLERAYEELITK